MMLFRRRRKLKAPPPPPAESTELDRVRAQLRATLEEADRRVEAILKRCAQLTGGKP
jgi:hypothetical protein